MGKAPLTSLIILFSSQALSGCAPEFRFPATTEASSSSAAASTPESPPNTAPAVLEIGVGNGGTIHFNLDGGIQFIDWGDGQTDASAFGNNSAEVAISHTYAVGGNYTITFYDDECVSFVSNSGFIVEAGNFQDFESMTNLSLGSNQIEQISTAELPPNLLSLALTNNSLTSIDTANLPETLTHLYLAYNDITSFDSTTLPASLNEVNLRYNQLNAFNTSNLPDLTVLYLDDNDLLTFDASTLPDSVHELSISSNSLITFNANSLPDDLHELNLANNQLTSFNTTNLPAGLQTLNLQTNLLTTFDASNLPISVQTFTLALNALDSANINAILAALVPKGFTFLDADLRNNSAPTGQGLADKTTLQNAGNTIRTE